MLGLPDVSEESLKANRLKYYEQQHAHKSRLSGGRTMGSFRKGIALRFRALVEAIVASLPANHQMQRLTWLDFPDCLECFTVGTQLVGGGLEPTWTTVGLAVAREAVRTMINDGVVVVKYQGKDGERLKFLLKLRTGMTNTSNGVGKGFCDTVII